MLQSPVMTEPRKKTGPKPKAPEDKRSRAILVKYSPIERKLLDKKRGVVPPAVYVREKSLS